MVSTHSEFKLQKLLKDQGIDTTFQEHATNDSKLLAMISDQPDDYLRLEEESPIVLSHDDYY